MVNQELKNALSAMEEILIKKIDRKYINNHKNSSSAYNNSEITSMVEVVNEEKNSAVLISDSLNSPNKIKGIRMWFKSFF
jgi:hypothetical protein